MFEDILNNKFADAADVLSYSNGTVKTLEMNDKFLPELWMNISEEDYFKAEIHNIFDDDNLDIFIKTIEKCIRTGEEQTCETWRSLVSDCCGLGRICLKSRFILIERLGDSGIVFEAVRNITNEKRTQDTLADIEHRYVSASEQINIYNWEYTIATKEMRPCYRCMRDLGLPSIVHNYPEPAIDAGIFPPDYADMYREMMRKIDAGAAELEADIPLTVGRVPFRVKYTTTFDENGVPIKAFGSATLISETELGHIRLNNEIISSLAEEYKSIYLLDFISNSVKVVKESDLFSFTGQLSCEEIASLFAGKIALISSGNEESPVGPESIKAQINLFSDPDMLRTKLFEDSNKREFSYKDEQTGKWIRIDYHVIDRNDQYVDRLLITASVLDDLSAQKMDADRLIAAQKAELEDRQVMLQNAITEANRANEAKTVFFSNMSHDIRTPMSAINGFSRLAKEDIDDKQKLGEYLDKIIIAGDHLFNLINDILDMSRIESGKMELAPVTVRMKDLITDCTEMIRAKTEEKGIDFTVDIDEVGDDPVKCDKLRFRQIMLNLLSNAYKFTPEGHSISVYARLADRSDKLRYEIHVKDTGIGMSKEFSEHIWEAFTREKTNFINETQGTGLGMAIVRNIINLMQGTVELKTELGKGSEFIIMLPLEPAEKDDSTEADDNTEVCDALNKRYDGKTILVVDDTELNLKLAEYELQKFGFNIKLSTSGVEAIEILKDSKPGDIDLVLMDVLMPVMDGLETTRRIRAFEDPAISGIPIIAMTANAFASDIQDVLNAGMNAHVPKPFEEKDLITKIDANLK